MSYHRRETLTDIAAAGNWVKLTCRCDHIARHDPLKIVKRLLPRRAPTQLHRLNQTPKCGKCGGKEFAVEHCEEPGFLVGLTKSGQSENGALPARVFRRCSDMQLSDY